MFSIPARLHFIKILIIMEIKHWILIALCFFPFNLSKLLILQVTSDAAVSC